MNIPGSGSARKFRTFAMRGLFVKIVSTGKLFQSIFSERVQNSTAFSALFETQRSQRTQREETDILAERIV
jgi:hypothetical protein